jgi:hypothetical protein
LTETFLNKVNNISTKDASSFQEVKNKFLNLHLVVGNCDLAHHMVSNKKTKMSKKRTTSYSSSSSEPSATFTKDVTSTEAKTCTWCTKHLTLNPNSHGRHECGKLKEFNKSVLTIKGKGKVHHVAADNPDTDFEVEVLIYQDAKGLWPNGF